MPASTASKTVVKAGKWVASSGSEAKLQVEMMMLDCKVKLHKEQFGLEVWDTVFEHLSMAKIAEKKVKRVE